MGSGGIARKSGEQMSSDELGCNTRGLRRVYGLIVIDRWRELVFDNDGQPREVERDTGEATLCDVALDGTLLTYGSQRRMEQIANSLMDELAGAEWRAVPLPLDCGGRIK